MGGTSHHSADSRPVLIAIAAVIVVYLVSAAPGLRLPQQATERIRQAESHEKQSHETKPHEGESHAADTHADEAAHKEGTDHKAIASAETNHDGDQASSDHGGQPAPPPIGWVTPFVLLLAAIAVFPLLPLTEHWWEHNRNRFLVAAGLGLVTLGYYAFLHKSGVEGHFPAHHLVEADAGGAMLAWTVLANAILHEYIPFIVLLFALYTISGGIRIQGDLQANPATNAAFMAVGGALASFIGTTGAAMLLIRPLLETNRERKHVQHTVVFFIFIVCNCGGCLLPIGDPPLFLGYLRGVDFLWTLCLWPEWLFTNLVLLGYYLALDEIFYYRRETKKDIVRDVTQTTRLRFEGHALNGLLLIGVIFSVALLAPNKPFPGTDWRPWMYLREIVQLGLVGLSLWLGSPKVREKNDFNYHAIVEVAALFCGIFICMQPALQILHVEGPRLGLDSSMMFFWVTGGLSSVLDNAPTYVVFFETAITLPEAKGATYVHPGINELHLTAVSLGSVFCGAMTYIGNGPNFMVKAIAEKSGVQMPSFFGYVFRYSLPFLLPVLLLVTWLFL